MYLSAESRRAKLEPVKLARPTRTGRDHRRGTEIQSVTSLDEFMRLHGAERHQLAIRRLSGEVLTERERSRLAAFDTQLDRLLPRPPARPEVTETLAEAKRLIQIHGHHHAE